LWQIQPEPQTRAASLIECFGWIDLFAGLFPFCILVAELYQFLFRHAVVTGSWFWLAAAGMLIPAWGAFCVIAGCANYDSLVPVLLIGLPVTPVAVCLSARYYLGDVAKFVVALDLAVHLYLLSQVRSPHPTPEEESASLFFRLQARMFAILDTVRVARTFHPDGTVIAGTATALEGHRFEAISRNLSGGVLVRGGSGIDSRFARQWFPRLNSPNLVVRFIASDSDQQADLLVLSVGTNLWNALWELVFFRANPYDYFRNSYSPWVPYHTPEGGPDVRFQIEPVAKTRFEPQDFAGREAVLRDAVEGKLAFEDPGFQNPVFEVQVQPLDQSREWTPVVRFTLDELLDTVDQEALHFQPYGKGRGFEPYTWWTTARHVVYPASFAARPGSQSERVRRRALSWGERVALYINGLPSVPNLESKPTHPGQLEVEVVVEKANPLC
jgi:hypothetical protein